MVVRLVELGDFLNHKLKLPYLIANQLYAEPTKLPQIEIGGF